MKKKIICVFTFYICCAILVLSSLMGAQVLLAELPAFSLVNNQKISINIDGYSAINFSRIKYFDNAIYLIDADGRKVIKHTETATSIIHETVGETSETTTKPYDIVSYGDKYLVSTTTLFIDYVDSINEANNTTLSHYKIDSIDDDNIALPPQTLAKSADGTTYTINGDRILYFNQPQKQLELYSTLKIGETSLSFQSGGGFCVMEDNSAIFFSIGEKIYKLDTQTKEITDSIYTADSGTITYLNTDNLGNLFVGVGNKIYKYNAQATEIPYAEMPEDTVSFDLDMVNGNVYYVNSANEVYCAQIRTENNESLITNYSEIAPSVKLTSIEASTSVINAVITTNETKIYQYKTLLAPNNAYKVGKRLIVLDSSNATFYYVFDNNFDSEAGYQLGYILKTDCEAIENEIVEEFADNQAAKVVTGITKIFALPISQAIATDTYIASIGRLNYGDTIAIIASPTLSKDSNGATFVAVKYKKNGTDYVGYIDSRTVVSSELIMPDTKSVPNAKTKMETIIYAEKNCFNKVDVLAKGCDVKIISTLNGVSKIEYYVIEDEEEIIKTGYCKSENLDTGELTTAQIVGLVLMSISIVVTVVVLIINHRRRKKRFSTAVDLNE